MEGFGVFYYPSGEIYRGEWMNNQRSGKGRLDTASGENEYYDGEWANDKKNGFGTFYYGNGNTYEGLWMDDKKEGPGKFFYAATGKVYEGEWVDDQPKCGEYRQPTTAEQSKLHPSTIRKENFSLPEIGLEAPGDVLETATANVRMENAERRGITSGVTLSEAKVSELKGIYHSASNAVSGLVALKGP